MYLCHPSQLAKLGQHLALYPHTLVGLPNLSQLNHHEITIKPNDFLFPFDISLGTRLEFLPGRESQEAVQGRWDPPPTNFGAMGWGHSCDTKR